MKHLPALATLSLIGLVGMPALGQSRSERVDKLTTMLATAAASDTKSDTEYVDAKTGQTIRATPAQLMRETLTNVDYDAIPGRLALEIWSNQTQVPLVVNWNSLEAQGVDTTTPITLKLNRVPAELILKLIIDQMHPDPIADDELLVDVQQWYVRVGTKRDALRRSTTKIYFIGDLLMSIPNFDKAPKFDLNEALSNTSSGGSNSGGGGGKGLFGGNDEVEEEREPSKLEKAEKIMDMIRDTIEPGIWLDQGGEYASVRYLNGMLIVKAPQFVHEQIGVPFSNSSKRTSRSSKTVSKATNKGVSGVQRKSSGLVP